jgi:hypothetical protein
MTALFGAYTRCDHPSIDIPNWVEDEHPVNPIVSKSGRHTGARVNKFQAHWYSQQFETLYRLHFFETGKMGKPFDFFRHK